MTWRKVFDAPLTDASRRVDEASRGFDASRPILRTSSKNTPKASECPSKTISAPHAFRRPSSRAFSFPRRFSSSSPSCRRTPSTSPSRSSSSATAGPGTGTNLHDDLLPASEARARHRCDGASRPSRRRARPGPQDSRGGGSRRALYVVIAMGACAAAVWWLKSTTGVACPWSVEPSAAPFR